VIYVKKDRLSRLKKARLYSDEERYTDWEEPNLEDDAELDEFQSQPRLKPTGRHTAIPTLELLPLFLVYGHLQR
jgi:hypothetical protein